MSTGSGLPPLKPLHSQTSLVTVKLQAFEKLSTEILQASLAPGQANCLKARPDGTILDGHHRIHVLRTRGEQVDQLPREIVERRTSEE
ncbi:MAG: hypothetical protein ACRD3E_03350 [Terriglobales bacterium]